MLRAVALFAAGAGGLVSVALLLQAGSRNNSLPWLVVLFSVWVLSPFMALLFAILRSDKWPEMIRTVLHVLTLAVTVGSLLIYAGTIDLKPAGSANMFLFVTVPPASWMGMVMGLLVATLVQRSRTRRAGLHD